MNNQQAVIQRAIEATEMGFWDSAIHRLLDAGWGVYLRPVESTLGSFHAEVTAKTNGLVMREDHDCPMFAGAYSKGFADALSNALHKLLKELA